MDDGHARTPFDQLTMLVESPLPALEPPQFQNLGLQKPPNIINAYRMILHAEATAIAQMDKENVIPARVAGHLLLELCPQRCILGDRPYERIIEELMKPDRPIDNNDDLVFEIGQRYRDSLIRGFRMSSAPYPPLSSHPSRTSYDNLLTTVQESLESTGKDYKTARKKVLARDGFRCVITGLFDRASVDRSTELQLENERLEGSAVPIVVCHILNESTTQGIEKSTVEYKAHYAAGIITTLRMFGLKDLADALEKVGGVHGAWNMLSLQSDMHSYFDHFDLWFEGTDTEHSYKVCGSKVDVGRFIRRNSLHPEDPLVLFRSGLGVPPPDPKLLALHATCARVAHMSGAAEFFDKLERDVEETEVLAFDGSSAHLLRNLMSPHALIHGVV